MAKKPFFTDKIIQFPSNNNVTMLRLLFNFREPCEEIQTCSNGNLHVKTVNTEIFILNLLLTHYKFIKFYKTELYLQKLK